MQAIQCWCGRFAFNSDALKSSALWDDLLLLLASGDERDELVLSISLTRSVEDVIVRGRTRIEVLGPGKYLAARGPGAVLKDGSRVTSNSISAVLRVLYEEMPVVVLGGDMDELSLGDIVAASVSMRAPVLVFPHHGGGGRRGSSEVFAKDLVGEVQPSTVLFSIGRYGRGATNPQPAVIGAIKSYSADMRIACTQLSQHCSAKGAAKRPGHLLPLTSRGRERGLCCAGTIVLPLDQPGRVFPDQEEHLVFIGESAETALCC